MQSTLLTHPPAWRSLRDPFTRALTTSWQDWLCDTGSLTQRLIQLSGGHFRVSILREDWRTPMFWEATALSLPTRQHARVREVALLCNDQPLVYARSVLPASTLTGKNRFLKNLGNKPLGAALFRCPNLERDPLVIAKIDALKPQPEIDAHHPAYARCSVFYLDHKPLLVSEIFLPAIIAYTNPHG